MLHIYAHAVNSIPLHALECGIYSTNYAFMTCPHQFTTLSLLHNDIILCSTPKTQVCIPNHLASVHEHHLLSPKKLKTVELLLQNMLTVQNVSRITSNLTLK